MVTVNVLDHVGQCYSNADGQIIQNLIRNSLDNNESITVSLRGITALNSSFVNTAFIDLLEFYDFSTIRNKLKIVNSTPQINKLIKDRFNKEIEYKKKLVHI